MLVVLGCVEGLHTTRIRCLHAMHLSYNLIPFTNAASLSSGHWSISFGAVEKGPAFVAATAGPPGPPLPLQSQQQAQPPLQRPAARAEAGQHREKPPQRQPPRVGQPVPQQIHQRREWRRRWRRKPHCHSSTKCCFAAVVVASVEVQSTTELWEPVRSLAATGFRPVRVIRECRRSQLNRLFQGQNS